MVSLNEASVVMQQRLEAHKRYEQFQKLSVTNPQPAGMSELSAGVEAKRGISDLRIAKINRLLENFISLLLKEIEKK